MIGYKMVARLPRTSATIVSNFRNNLQSIDYFKELNVFVKDTIVSAEKKVDEITRERDNGLSTPRRTNYCAQAIYNNVSHCFQQVSVNSFVSVFYMYCRAVLFRGL